MCRHNSWSSESIFQEVLWVTFLCQFSATCFHSKISGPDSISTLSETCTVCGPRQVCPIPESEGYLFTCSGCLWLSVQCGMLPELREGMGTAEGWPWWPPAWPVPGGAERGGGWKEWSPAEGKRHVLCRSGVSTQSRGPGDHPQPCSTVHMMSFPGTPAVPGGAPGFEKDTPKRGSRDVSGSLVCS